MNTDLQILKSFLDISLSSDLLLATDAIFLFASHEKERAIEAARLFKDGKARSIIVTGGFNHYPELLPKEFKTESDFLEAVLLKEGVSANSIIKDPSPQNLLENVLFGMRTVRERGENLRSLIAFSWFPLLPRVVATFAKHFSEIKIIPYSLPVPEDDFPPDAINRILGEIERLKLYYEKGDIAEIIIPETVFDAYVTLKQQINGTVS